MNSYRDQYHRHWRYCTDCQEADRHAEGATHCATGAKLNQLIQIMLESQIKQQARRFTRR